MKPAARVERALTRLAEAGYAAYVIPLGFGWALAATASELFPNLGASLHPRYGGILLVLAAFLSTVAGFCAVHRRRGSRDPTLAWFDTSRWLGWRLGWGLSVPLLIAAFAENEDKHAFRVLALGLASAVPVAATTWRLAQARTEGAPPESQRSSVHPAAWLGIGLLGAAYATLLSWLAIGNHLSFNTRRADLGFYVSIFRRSSLGDWLGCSLCGGGNHLSGHFDPLLVLLSPLYLLYPKAETLLVLQSAWLASSLVPLCLLCLHYGLRSWEGVVLAALFCVYPALHGANLYDFHSLTLMIPIALWWLWAFERDRKRLYWVIFALMLLTREDVALLAIAVGASVFMSKRPGSATRGALTMSLALGYFVLVKVALMEGADPLRPGKGTGYAYYYSSLVPKGGGTAELITSVFTNPEVLLTTALTEQKTLFLLLLAMPVLFVPLVARSGRLQLVYGLLFCLLATREFVPTVHFHYTSLLIPFVFALTAGGLGRLKTLRWGSVSGRALVPALLAAMVVTSSVASAKFGGLVPNRTFKAGFRALKRSPSSSKRAASARLDEFCRSVSSDQVVAAGSTLLPHLGRCPSILLRERRYDADFLLWQRGSGDEKRAIEGEIRSGSLKLVRELGGRYAVYSTHYSPRERKRLKRARSRRHAPQRKSSAKSKRKD